MQYDRPGIEAFVSKLVGIKAADLDWASSLGKKYGAKEELDGRGDAARHLALGWLAANAESPATAKKAIQAREYLDTDYIREVLGGKFAGKEMDLRNNELGMQIPAKTREEAEQIIGQMIEGKEATFMTPQESYEMRGYAEGGAVTEVNPEEGYGVIKAPDYPVLAKGAEYFRDIERRVKGSPAEFFLPGGGIAQIMERKAYGEDPSALEYGMAAIDAADVTPVGKLAMFLGPAAKSGVEGIARLLKREGEGASPTDIWAEQVADKKRVFRYDVDGRPRIELDTSEARLRPDSHMANSVTPVRQIRLFDADPDDIVGKKDIKMRGRPLVKGDYVDETARLSHTSTYRSTDFSAENKGPLKFGEIIDFPTLLEEYPDIADVRIEKMPSGIAADGMYVPATNTIHLRGGTEQKTLSTLLHEAQHWIQNYEGFPFGTTPDDIPKDLKQRQTDMAKKFRTTVDRMEKFLEPTIRSSMDVRGDEISDALVKQETKHAVDMLTSLFKGYRETKLPDETFSDYVVRKDYGRLPDSLRDAPAALQSSSKPLFDHLAPFLQRFDNLEDEAARLQYQVRRAEEESLKKYSAVAGEVESRNVQTRLADPTLRNVSPNQTLDTPLDEIYYSEIIPPTSKIFDDYGTMIMPQKKANGGGIAALAPRAKAMFNTPDIRRGVAAFAPYTTRRA